MNVSVPVYTLHDVVILNKESRKSSFSAHVKSIYDECVRSGVKYPILATMLADATTFKIHTWSAYDLLETYVDSLQCFELDWVFDDVCIHLLGTLNIPDEHYKEVRTSLTDMMLYLQPVLPG